MFIFHQILGKVRFFQTQRRDVLAAQIAFPEESFQKGGSPGLPGGAPGATSTS